MDDKCIRHKRFTVGQSFVMTGIAHFFHLLAPHRLQFRFSAWGSMTVPVQQLRQACRISLRGHSLAPYRAVEAPSLAEHYSAIAAALVSASFPCASLGAQITFQLKRCACALQR